MAEERVARDVAGLRSLAGDSVGVVTVHGQTVLLAILTQHGRDFESGIDLVESLAKIAAGVVAPS